MPQAASRTGVSAMARPPQAGMTLIELMVVLAVVGILTAIAYPSYQGSVSKARRADGKTLLLDIAARQERYFMDSSSYTTTLTQLGYGVGTLTSSDGFYSATVAAGPSGSITSSYTITATPVTAQWGNGGDTQCGNLLLDSRGNQTSSLGTTAACWN
ncbi:MAG: type IV pilin protein [Gammaproteobacteria bacterium]|nr:type IV pilin protein [Gammaproteobacteria bacterium]